MFHVVDQRVRSGVDRLLTAPSDLLRWDAHLVACERHEASQPHRQLFDAYVAELRPAVMRAIEIWDAEIAWAVRSSDGQSAAEESQWATYPAGPAVQPFFVEIVRRYWLACDELNREAPSPPCVAPEFFMLGWLADQLPVSDPVLQVLSCMPYWPIGQDFEGRWC